MPLDMQKPLISIIIPAYNAVNYLGRCLTSVCQQSYGNLEIILVNDGSTDNTPKLCDEWASKDSRIRIIHQSNKGLAEVCNEGLRKASGEFIAFVDSDDWIEPEMFEELYASLIKEGSDIAVCGILLETKAGKLISKLGCKKEKTIHYLPALKKLLIDKSEKSYRWNKLYRSKLFQDISFPPGRVFEDLNTVYKLYARAKAISYTGSYRYHYIQHGNSILGSSNTPEKEMDFFTAQVERFDFILSFEAFSEKEKKALCIRTMKRLLSSACKIHQMTSPAEYRAWKEDIKRAMTTRLHADFHYKSCWKYILCNYWSSLPYLHLYR